VPKRSPFTRLCGTLAALGPPPRADLHTHSTASDGAFTPSQVVARARAARLSAVALTDHDTLAGVPEARAAATGTGLEVVPAVEISTAFAGREFHLLGFFVREDRAELNAALARLCAARRARYYSFVDALRARGLALPPDRAELIERGTHSPGRRHVAGLLVACGHAGTVHEAFRRFVSAAGASAAPKELLPIGDAIRLVRAAGGVASLAHPPDDLTDGQVGELAGLGLGALEAAYRWPRAAVAARWRAVAARFGLAVSGGSDCHGPVPAAHGVGAHAITCTELEALRDRAGCVLR
jgi:predicted metal-dependent phosphoesterase TrpH